MQRILLAIESSGKPLSLALFKDQDLVEEIYKEPDGRGHSETLLPLVHELLNAHRISIHEITEVALSIGPGSYTSLRVGAATVLGLFAGRDIPIYGISSLAAMAYGARTEAPYRVPVLQAGRGRVYAAVYLYLNNEFKTCVPDSTFEPTDLMKTIKEYTPVFLFGPGVLNLGENIPYPHDSLITPRASQIGFLANQNKLTPLNPNQIQLTYLQEPDFGK